VHPPGNISVDQGKKAKVTAALDKGIPFDVIMIDFRRAFDLVPFEHMLKKLEAHGIVGDVLKWITD